ncbi:uncharacterized protein LOC135367828 [Ornithodoros turicata]|uniref:uncharacterized protein LOC135367828 n=1 Tax=Ornithodoros turicata TaxID=34597 RepID=UPI003138B09F
MQAAKKTADGASVQITTETAVSTTTVITPPGSPGTLPVEVPKGTGSRIEITTKKFPNAEQSGSCAVFGCGKCNVQTTVSEEGANYVITAEDGQVRTIHVPAAKSKSGSAKAVLEKRVTLEDGIEIIEEFEDGVMVRKTLNGKEQPLQEAAPKAEGEEKKDK